MHNRQVITEDFYRKEILKQFKAMIADPTRLSIAVEKSGVIRHQDGSAVKGENLSELVNETLKEDVLNPEYKIFERVLGEGVYRELAWPPLMKAIIQGAVWEAASIVYTRYPYMQIWEDGMSDRELEIIQNRNNAFKHIIDSEANEIAIQYIRKQIKNVPENEFRLIDLAQIQDAKKVLPQVEKEDREFEIKEIEKNALLNRLNSNELDNLIAEVEELSQPEYRAQFVENEKYEKAVNDLHKIITPYYEDLVHEAAVELQKLLSLANEHKSIAETSAIIIENFKASKRESNAVKDLTMQPKMRTLYEKIAALEPLQDTLANNNLKNKEKLEAFAHQLTPSARVALSTKTSNTFTSKLKKAAYIVANIIPGLGFLISAIKNGTPAFWKTKGSQIVERADNVINKFGVENLNQPKKKPFSIHRFFKKSKKAGGQKVALQVINPPRPGSGGA